MKLGYPYSDIKFSDRKAYYDAFDSYHLKHDVKPKFIEYLLNNKDDE